MAPVGASRVEGQVSREESVRAEHVLASIEVEVGGAKAGGTLLLHPATGVDPDLLMGNQVRDFLEEVEIFLFFLDEAAQVRLPASRLANLLRATEVIRDAIATFRTEVINRSRYVDVLSGLDAIVDASGLLRRFEAFILNSSALSPDDILAEAVPALRSALALADTFGQFAPVPDILRFQLAGRLAAVTAAVAPGEGTDLLRIERSSGRPISLADPLSPEIELEDIVLLSGSNSTEPSALTVI